MFGEHESESPRVPSPWDPFLPSPPSRGISPQSNIALHNGVPKLVPEVEEGNVEYKLKLTNISNARFTRLVTQLKWRLLEGGGQAYYELGVADSGALIGLSRADLEESLSTLEMMAGEIGASVIVVKEIEVPPTIAALADKESRYTDPDTGEWTRKMRLRPVAGRGPLSNGGDGSMSATTTEAETDFSNAETPDIEDEFSNLYQERDAARFFAMTASIAHRPVRTDPSRPTAQSSPFITPIDDDLALFSMEPEHAFEEEPPDGDMAALGMMADDELDSVGPLRASFAGLEIAAVYKPRPIRHRMRYGGSVPGPTAGRHNKRWNKPKERDRERERKVQPWHQKGAAGMAQDEVSKEERALQRRLARDKKREEKRNALVTLGQGETQEAITNESHGPATVLGDPGDGHVGGKVVETNTLATGVNSVEDVLGGGTLETLPVLDEVVVTDTGREGRLIVEALVVRKMSIEEATLDFGRLAIL